MGREIVLFSSQERQSRPQVVAFLRDLADRIDGGEVTFKQGADSVTVNLPHNLVLELKVETEDKNGREKRSLEVEIEWYEGDEVDTGVTLG
ncbi:MAG: amphi-Trp domain-containing protein [Chloroflexota bacterium]|jgi:amphi-Trp domain-containing protein